MKRVGSKKRLTDLTNTDAFHGHSQITPRSSSETYPKLSTHNLSFTQKPFEVVFLDVHEAGDVWDVKAVVLHVLCLQVYLVTWNKNLAEYSTQQTTDYREPSDRDINTSFLDCIAEQAQLRTASVVCVYLVELFQQPKSGKKIVLIEHGHEHCLASS